MPETPEPINRSDSEASQSSKAASQAARFGRAREQAPKRVSNVARLATTHPELASQWHPTLNGECTAQSVTALSNYRAWWLCEFGHEWNRQISRRTNFASGCPTCELEAESLATLYPELTQQWSPKNGTLDPRRVRVNEEQSVWWICINLKHEDFKRSVRARIKEQTPYNCLICAGIQPPVIEPLAITHPDIAKNWHPVKNCSLTPHDLTARSQLDVWWVCARNSQHEWRQKVCRQLTHECKLCKLEMTNLLLQYPDIAAQWHKEKNGALTPEMVTPGSSKLVWWQCDKFEDHVWQAEVAERTIRKTRCKFCANRLVDERNSLAKRYPKIAEEWHPSKNLPLTPDSVTSGSSKKVWWLCKENSKHVWEATIIQRTGNLTGCPHCARVNSSNNFAKFYPEIAAEWHPTKNGHLFPSWDPKSPQRMLETSQKNRRLKPSDFASGSNHVAWWQCKKSKLHVWCTAIANRTLGGHSCPFCVNQKIAKDNSLASKNKPLTKLWHPTRNLPLTPNDVTAGSTKLIWWRCFKSPFHVWQQSVSVVKRAYDTHHSGCPFCTGRKLGKDNHLAAKHQAVAKLWHPTRNLPLAPNLVLPFSNRTIWWQCPKSIYHVWKSKPGPLVIRSKNGKNPCIFCKGYKVAKEESLAILNPDLLMYWDKSRNLQIKPKQVSPSSCKVVHWRCPNSGDHRWKMSVRDMVKRKQKCKLCATNFESGIAECESRKTRLNKFIT